MGNKACVNCAWLAEAEARLAAAEKVKINMHKLDLERACRIAALEHALADASRAAGRDEAERQRLAAERDQAVKDRDRDWDINDGHIAELEAELAAERIDCAYWTVAALHEHDENDRLRESNRAMTAELLREAGK